MGKNRAIGYLLATAAAVAYGITSILIKKGVSDFAPPLVGATIAVFFGMTFVVLPGFMNFDTTIKNERRAALFFVLAGVSAAIGVCANYGALSLAPVVVVAPITNIAPLVTLLMAHIVLKQLERITLRLILGAILVVLGVILITLGKNLP